MRLDEVHMLTSEKVYGIASFAGVSHDDRRLVARRVAIEIGSGEEDLRADKRRAEKGAMGNFAANLGEIFDLAADVANGGDAIGDEQWKNEFAAAGGFAGTGEVDMHVGEAGNEELAGGVEDRSIGRHRRGCGGTDGGNLLADDDDSRIGFGRGAGGVNDGGVDDRKGKRAIRAAGDEGCEKQRGKGARKEGQGVYAPPMFSVRVANKGLMPDISCKSGK